MASSLTDFDHLSDVTLVCDEEKFRVHKAVMCSRCKFFEAMLGGRFAESTQSEVALDCMSATVLRRIVEYVQCDVLCLF
jgi:hypothetical protein